jgi:phosphopantetheine--protein transferase-like protein
MAHASSVFRCTFVPVDANDCNPDTVTKWMQWMSDEWNSRNVDCSQYCMTPQQYFDRECNPAVGRPKDESQMRSNCIGGNALWKEQGRCIQQYIKPQDQCMALVSLLLKSRAFYEARRPFDNVPDGIFASDISPSRPVVVLPRTRFNQPYIPMPQTSPSDDAASSASQDPVSFSISHQYPVVGIVQQLASSGPPQYCGLDIVMFDPYHESLYASTMDFIAVFQDLFSPQEWNCILQCHQDEEEAAVDRSSTRGDDHLLLREFYIRWSMKEAYTKAFGMGINFNFASFESIHIIPASSGQPENTSATDSKSIRSLYRWIKRSSMSTSRTDDRPNAPVCAIGTVTQLSNASTPEDPVQALRRPEQEAFWFFFYPLYEQSITKATVATTVERHDSEAIDHGSVMIGCACICVGPMVPSHDASVYGKGSNPDIQVEWTSLHQLCTFHTSAV